MWCGSYHKVEVNKRHMSHEVRVFEYRLDTSFDYVTLLSVSCNVPKREDPKLSYNLLYTSVYM